MTSALLLLALCFFCCGPKAEPLGVFGASRLSGVLGQDGVTPIPFDETLTLWTFGDTILGSWKGEVSTSATFSERADINSFLSNSLATTPPPTVDNIRNLTFSFYREKGKIAPFIRLLPGESPSVIRLWALDGIRIDDRVYVYYYRIRITDPGKFLAFEPVALGLAAWRVPAGWAPGDAMGFERLPDLFRGNAPAFGSSVIRKDGFIYTVGHYAPGDGSSPVKFAKVEEGRINDPGAYVFLDLQGRWVRDIDSAHPFLGDIMGECSLSYNESLKSYLLVYCQQWTGSIIMVRFRDFHKLGTASKEVVYSPPALEQKGSFPPLYYSGKEIFSSGKTLYAIYINPLEYQPYLLKIRL